MCYNLDMGRKIQFAPKSYFHIYNRGTEKREIFIDNNDYRRFLILLYLCNNTSPVSIRNLLDKGLTFGEIFNIERKETLVDIGTYCLMNNHVHLLVKNKTENGISRFTQKLFTGYTMYFNKKNKRTGSLFESTFKANLVDKNEYLKYLFAYIHLNPIKLMESGWKEKGIKDIDKAKIFLKNYLWSSYPFYIGERENDPILNKQDFPRYFDNNKEFNEFVNDWLSFPEV